MEMSRIMSGSYENFSVSQQDPDEVSYEVSPAVPQFVYIMSCCFMAIICCFGVLANLSIFVLFYNSPLIRTPFNYILMNMVFAETLIASYGLPIDFAASFNYGWKLGKNLCVTTGFILTTSGTVSIMTLAALSCQRYMTIINPDRYKVTSYKSAFSIIAGIWIWTMCISVPPFFGFGAYVPETSGMTCAPDWESNKHIVYTIYWLVTGFLIPLFVILYSSYKTTRQMRNQTNFTRSENVKRMSQKREKKICALVIWMNIAFLVCWMPYGVICFMYIFGGRGYVSPSVVVIPLLAAKTSVCWNPIIYIAMNPQFRGAFKRFVKSRDEKELERRWTRINRNAPAHCSLVQSNSRFRSSMRSRQRKLTKRAKFLNVMKKPSEISSRGDWTNPNLIDYTTESSRSYSTSTKKRIMQVEMKAVALLNVRNLAIGIVIAHQRSESPTSELEAPDYPDMAKCSESEPTNIVVKENIVEADVHCEAANHAAVEEDVSCSVSQQSSESDQMKMKRVQICRDPYLTSKPNGWIYACFEQVEINEGLEPETAFILSRKSSDRGCYLDYLNGKNDLLNALNLMSFKHQKENQVTQLIAEHVLIKNLPPNSITAV